MSDPFEKINQNRELMISALAQSMVVYGVTPSIGRIYGVLYFAKEPMSLDDIKDHVAMSKASVSIGLRKLLEIEMVIKVWEKGSRKDYYVAEKDFFKNFISFTVKNMRQERSIYLRASDQVKPVLEEIIENSDSETAKQEAAQDLKDIEHALSFYDWMQNLAHAMDSGQIYKYFPKTNKTD